MIPSADLAESTRASAAVELANVYEPVPVTPPAVAVTVYVPAIHANTLEAALPFEPE